MTEKKGKIIDEKGKLFGKINLIDLMVIALILVVGIVVAVKFLGRSSGLPGAVSGTQIIYTVRAPSVPDEVVETVKAEFELGGEHTQLMANGEMLPANITAVTAEPHNETEPGPGGVMVISSEPGVQDMIFTVEATVQNPITQKVGSQEIRIGKKDHIMKTKTIELQSCTILTCETVEKAK